MITRTYTIHCMEQGGLKAHVDRIDDLFDSEMHDTITDEQDLFIDKRDVFCVDSEEGRYEYAIRYRITEKSFSKSETNTLLSGKKDAGWLPTWNDVGGKPSTFAPSTHTHSQYSLTSHNHDTNYKAIGWTPSWGDVTGKPSTFAPSTHTHSQYSLTTHTHDDRYYTESEADARYFKKAGDTMQLGEGLQFTHDGNYFGTNMDARIIRLLDTNGSGGYVDGGLVFNFYTPTDQVEIEGLRIRNNEFAWKGSPIVTHYTGDIRYSLSSHSHSEIIGKDGITHDSNFYEKKIFAIAQNNTGSNQPINYTTTLHVGACDTKRSFQIASSYGSSNAFYMRSMYDNGNSGAGSWLAWERLITEVNGDTRYKRIYKGSSVSSYTSGAYWKYAHIATLESVSHQVQAVVKGTVYYENSKDNGTTFEIRVGQNGGTLNYAIISGFVNMGGGDSWEGMVFVSWEGTGVDKKYHIHMLHMQGPYPYTLRFDYSIEPEVEGSTSITYFDANAPFLNDPKTAGGLVIGNQYLQIGAGNPKEILTNMEIRSTEHIRADKWFYESGIKLADKYAALAHNHDGVYSLSAHNHDSVYGKLASVNYWTSAQAIQRGLTESTILSRVPGDPNWRFFMDVDGKLEWRNGADSTMRAKIWRDGNDLNLQAASTVNFNSVARFNNALSMGRDGFTYQTYMGLNATNSTGDHYFNYYYGTTRQGHLRTYASGLFRVHGDTRLLLSSGTTVDIDKPIVATGGMTMNGNLQLEANTTIRVARTIGIYQGYGDGLAYPRQDSSLSFGYYDGTRNVRDWVIGMLYQGGGSTRTRFYISYDDGLGSQPSNTYQAKFWWSNKTIRFNDYVGIGGEASTSYSLKTYGGVSVDGVLSLGMDVMAGYVPDTACSLQAVKHIQCLGAMYMIKGTAVIGDVLFTVPASTESCWEITYWENLNTPIMVKAILLVGANNGSNYSLNYPTRSDNTYGIHYTTTTREVRLSAPTGRTYHYTVMRTY